MPPYHVRPATSITTAHTAGTASRHFGVLWLVCLLVLVQGAWAGVGDPQLGTDHAWYPGELACSTFARLEETQAELFARVTGARPQGDEQRALAAWLWRNTHYWHGEEGAEDLWGRGFRADNLACREYWTGLFAHGFGLCGTTHAQWTAELDQLLGHARSRVVGVEGHNSLEVFLTGGPYGSGRWALLDHDICSVVFDPEGQRMLSIAEIRSDLARVADPRFRPERQHGWPLGGLHPEDPRAFAAYRVAEYLAGYAGAPPMVYLRRGEKLRRYFEPGLEDGHTFVFWGRNYRAQDIPGPERSRTWVNQPERFRSHPQGSGYRVGQARFANAVYEYMPDFASDSYREGVVDEGPDHVTFEFVSPYIIAATPPNDGDWGIYESGCHNGLRVSGDGGVPVQVSVDCGATWIAGGPLAGTLDLTDAVKGHRQYLLRLGRGASQLRDAHLRIVTVCQANAAVMPRLKDGGTRVTFAASGRGLVSAGPNLPQAMRHRVAGELDGADIELELSAPRGEPVVGIYAAAHVASGNPPDPAIVYRIDVSRDRGQTYQPLIDGWRIVRRGEEPADFWSQSFCYGSRENMVPSSEPVRVRFRNDAHRRYLRVEVQLAYRVAGADATRATFCWSDSTGVRRTASHVFEAPAESPATWDLETAQGVRTHWVELEPQAK